MKKRVINGWTVTSMIVDAETNEELDFTEENVKKIVEQMVNAAGYRICKEEESKK